MTLFFYFFFFNDTATTEIYTLSLHDALPISRAAGAAGHSGRAARGGSADRGLCPGRRRPGPRRRGARRRPRRPGRGDGRRAAREVRGHGQRARRAAAPRVGRGRRGAVHPGRRLFRDPEGQPGDSRGGVARPARDRPAPPRAGLAGRRPRRPRPDAPGARRAGVRGLLLDGARHPRVGGGAARRRRVARWRAVSHGPRRRRPAPAAGRRAMSGHPSSRERYRKFVEDYKHHRRDDSLTPEGPAPAAGVGSGKRREYLREYLRWLRPHRYAVAGLFLLALLVTGLELIDPLFMRFIIDRVLLNSALDTAARLVRLNLVGAAFVGVVILSNVIGATRDYRQRLLNNRAILSLRRSLYKRFLHLPLPRLWDMKTGGILSRLTGDVETTTGLLQLAIVSPAISVIRLTIAIAVLLTINWRLALTALAVIPGAILASLTFSRSVRPIYRSVRKDVEQVDGRVGETFSGIRVVRAFRREMWELFDYMVGRHTVLRKEQFAQRRELVLWPSWGLLQAAVNVVIIWYGGYMNIAGAASIGDIMAFQWYTFLLMGPVWNIVNSFSELQRSLAAMERVFEVLAMPDDMPDRPGARPAPRVVEELRFEHVDFAYREGHPVLRDFDVAVPGGSVIALVGRSGAGKTTVTDLVARFHDPTRGRILLNGR